MSFQTPFQRKEIMQSTNDLMVVEPVNFYSNPETKETNSYQSDHDKDTALISKLARDEFRVLRDRLVEAGVCVTTILGQITSPDDVFCNNWVATFAGSKLVYYPMMAPNRRLERRADIKDWLERRYTVALDLSAYEDQNKALESTGSHCLDRVNKVAYIALSDRTDEELALIFSRMMGFEPVVFRTKNHVGKPVYHADVMMFIGTGYAAICADVIVEEDRARVIKTLQDTHELIFLSYDQLRNFCGNALEIRGTNQKKLLALSSNAFAHLTSEQKKLLEKYDVKTVYAPIPTIEKYGGGSVRCMLLELH
jgi:hypothetical protein